MRALQPSNAQNLQLKHFGFTPFRVQDPQTTPPSITREDAFVNLQVFPRYYETAEDVRNFLSSNSV